MIVNLIDMKPASSDYSEIPDKYVINLNCESKIEDLIKFMYDIRNSDRLFSVEKLRLNPKERGSVDAKCSMSVSKMVVK